MATLKQVTANRANAKRSTGPRTEDGKSRSRLNSWKHGLTAQEITTGSEDPTAFEALRAELWHEFQPTVGLESVVLDRLASYAWRLRRIPRLEKRCLGNPITIDFGNAPFINTLSRYETALLNAFHRTLQQLLALRDRRLSEEHEQRTVDLLKAPANDDAP